MLIPRRILLSLIMMFGALCANGIETEVEVEAMTEDELKEVVDNTEFVLVLYSPDPCYSQECDNIHKQFEVVASSVTLPNVRAIVVENAMLAQKLGINNEPKMVFYRNSVPIFFDVTLFDSEEAVVWIDENVQSFVRFLDDTSFEHETQAATGATTGDWFVRFYTPDCDDIAAVWDTVASRLHGTINVASVDMEVNSGLEKRFHLVKCPTILFFHHGKVFSYELPVNSVESFISFAEGWYKNAPSKPVPEVPTPFDTLADGIVDWLKSIEGGVGFASLSSAIAAIAVLLLVAAILVLCCLRSSGREKTD